MPNVGQIRHGALIAALLSLAALMPVLAFAGDDELRTISHHTDAGRGFVSVATEVVVAKPERIVLKVRVKPNVRVDAKYITRCRSGEGQRDGTSEKLRIRSKEIELPIFFTKPKDCPLYAEASRDKRGSNLRVRLSMRVLADQRPGVSFRNVRGRSWSGGWTICQSAMTDA